MRTPGPYLRMDNCIYVLERTDRIFKGMDQFQNRIYAGFQGGPNTPKEEVEATAAYFKMAANCHDELVAELEAIKVWFHFFARDIGTDREPNMVKAVTPVIQQLEEAFALVKSQEAPDEG